MVKQNTGTWQASDNAWYSNDGSFDIYISLLHAKEWGNGVYSSQSVRALVESELHIFCFFSVLNDKQE